MVIKCSKKKGNLEFAWKCSSLSRKVNEAGKLFKGSYLILLAKISQRPKVHSKAILSITARLFLGLNIKITI